MRMLKGPNRIIKNFYGVDVDKAMRIKGKKGYGVSIAVCDSDGDFNTYCSGSGRYGEDFPVNPDMLFQAGSVSKPMFALTLLRCADKGLIDVDADISGVVPEFVKKGPVTFAALLSHTAGYNLHGFPGYRADHEPLSLEDVLCGKGVTPKLRRIRPYGKQHMYSGGGITLAELAFTRITGTTLREARGLPKGGRRASGAETHRLFPAAGRRAGFQRSVRFQAGAEGGRGTRLSLLSRARRCRSVDDTHRACQDRSCPFRELS